MSERRHFPADSKNRGTKEEEFVGRGSGDSFAYALDNISLKIDENIRVIKPIPWVLAGTGCILLLWRQNAVRRLKGIGQVPKRVYRENSKLPVRVVELTPGSLGVVHMPIMYRVLGIGQSYSPDQVIHLRLSGVMFSAAADGAPGVTASSQAQPTSTENAPGTAQSSADAERSEENVAVVGKQTTEAASRSSTVVKAASRSSTVAKATHGSSTVAKAASRNSTVDTVDTGTLDELVASPTTRESLSLDGSTSTPPSASDVPSATPTPSHQEDVPDIEPGPYQHSPLCLAWMRDNLLNRIVRVTLLHGEDVPPAFLYQRKFPFPRRTFINRDVIRLGLAEAAPVSSPYLIKSDIRKLSSLLLQAEQEAEKARVGIWQKQRPSLRQRIAASFRWKS